MRCRRETPIVPDGNDALALQQAEMDFELIPQTFVLCE